MLNDVSYIIIDTMKPQQPHMSLPAVDSITCRYERPKNFKKFDVLDRYNEQNYEKFQIAFLCSNMF